MRAIFFALLAHILGEGARYRQTCIALWKVLSVPQGVGPPYKVASTSRGRLCAADI